MKHYPIARKKWNEKLFFCIFSEIGNTFFWFDKGQIFSNFNEVIKFIDKKTRKPFFQLFLTENHNTSISPLLTTCKKKYKTKISLYVS